MDGPRNVGACLAGACMTLLLAANALANPAIAFADQSGSGEMAVFVTMEHEDPADVPTSQHGDVGKDAEAAPSPAGPGGALPKTGDIVGVGALGVALCGATSAATALYCQAKNRLACDDGGC